MRKNQIFIFLLLVSLTATAQDASLLCSERFRPAKGGSGATLIGGDDAGYWIHERTGDRNPTILFTRLNTNLETLWRKNFELPQPDETSRQDIVHVELIQGYLYIFSSGRRSDAAEYQAYVTVLDSELRRVSGPVLIHFVADIWKSGRPQFIVRVSEDRQRILVLFDSPYERKSNESIAIKVYDPALELLWEQTLELPYGQDVVQVHSFDIDNEGGVYLMSGHTPKKNTMTWQRPQGNRYVVFYYNHGEGILREYDVSLKDKQVVSARFAIDAGGQLFIAGYYSSDFTFSAAGTFLFILSPRAETVTVASFMPFPPELLLKYMGPRQAEKQGGLPDFYPDHLVLRSDGSCWLIGEQFAISENLMLDPMTGRQLIERRYTYEDILVVHLNPDGRILKAERIPKRQFDVNSNPHLSYVCQVADETLHFFFNDNPDNEKRLQGGSSDPLSWNGSRGAVVTHTSVSTDAITPRKTILRYKGNEQMLRPDLTRDASAHSVLLGLSGPPGYSYCIPAR